MAKFFLCLGIVLLLIALVGVIFFIIALIQTHERELD